MWDRFRSAPVARSVATVMAVGFVALWTASCSGSGDDETLTASSARGTETSSSSTTTTAPPLASLHLETTQETPEDLPGYRVYRPADLDAIDEPMPVISWANGGCVRFDGVWEPLLTRWAAAGLVVIAITSTEGVPVDQSDRTTPEDQLAALDWAEAQNQLPGGPYEGKFDVGRMATAGNSCGGITAIGAAGLDDRVASVFVLSGSGALPGSPPEHVRAAIEGVDVPIAYVTGGPEDISRAAIDAEYELLADRVPAYVALRSEGDHVAVSTTESILADEVAGIGINWFDLVFNGNEVALTALTDNPCPQCPAELWTAKSTNLESLVSA